MVSACVDLACIASANAVFTHAASVISAHAACVASNHAAALDCVDFAHALVVKYRFWSLGFVD